MKVFVTMKDPDTLYEAINDARDKLVDELMETAGLDGEEAEAVAEKRAEKMREFAAQYFEWGEYLTIELNDLTGTARVVPTKETRS